MPDQTLEPKCRHHFFLAVKECLHNSLKHAGATRVQITSEIADQSLRVAVSDNGCGFEPGVVGQQGEGLRNMQERMKAVAGRLEMVSRPGTGTRLTFEMPLEK
jgi:signal transduction histidine kinase